MIEYFQNTCLTAIWQKHKTCIRNTPFAVASHIFYIIANEWLKKCLLSGKFQQEENNVVFSWMFMHKEVVNFQECRSQRPSASGPQTRYCMYEHSLDVSTFTGGVTLIKFGSCSLMELKVRCIVKYTRNDCLGRRNTTVCMTPVTLLKNVAEQMHHLSRHMNHPWPGAHEVRNVEGEAD